MAEWGLSYFTRLTALQRSCEILKDVLSYRLEEISEILDSSVASIKGALHRGRTGLRRLAASEEEPSRSALRHEEAEQLSRCVALFNARDFDGLRDLLGEDVRLDLVEKTERSGATDVGSYFDNYARLKGIRFEVGVVDGRLAILAHDHPGEPPSYCLFVRFRSERVQTIRTATRATSLPRPSGAPPGHGHDPRSMPLP